MKEREAKEMQLESDVAKLQHQHEESEHLCASLQRTEDSAREALEQKSQELAGVNVEKLRLKEEGEESLGVLSLADEKMVETCLMGIQPIRR